MIFRTSIYLTFLSFENLVTLQNMFTFYCFSKRSKSQEFGWADEFECEIVKSLISKEAKNITPTMKEKNCYDLMVIFMPGGQSNCTTKRHLLRICDCDAQSAIPYVNHPLELNGFLNNHQPIYSDYRKSLFVQQFFLFYYSEVAWLLRITFR